MSKEKKPFLCSVCGTTWESASKRIPRHRCKGEFKGKVGTGIPAEGHPDYEPIVVDDKPIEGDIVFDVGESKEAMEIQKPQEEKEEIYVLEEKKEEPKKEEPAIPMTKGDAKTSKSITPALMETLSALVSGENLSQEQASLLSAQLVEGAVEVETSPVKAEITGLPLLIGIGILTVGLFWKAMYSKKKPKEQQVQSRFSPNTEEW